MNLIKKIALVTLSSFAILGVSFAAASANYTEVVDDDNIAYGAGDQKWHLMGSMNGWAADDKYKFYYNNNQYELVVELKKNEEFKIVYNTSTWVGADGHTGDGIGTYLSGSGGSNFKVKENGVYVVVVADDNVQNYTKKSYGLGISKLASSWKSGPQYAYMGIKDTASYNWNNGTYVHTWTKITTTVRKLPSDYNFPGYAWPGKKFDGNGIGINFEGYGLIRVELEKGCSADLGDTFMIVHSNDGKAKTNDLKFTPNAYYKQEDNTNDSGDTGDYAKAANFVWTLGNSIPVKDSTNRILGSVCDIQNKQDLVNSYNALSDTAKSYANKATIYLENYDNEKVDQGDYANYTVEEVMKVVSRKAAEEKSGGPLGYLINFDDNSNVGAFVLTISFVAVIGAVGAFMISKRRKETN